MRKQAFGNQQATERPNQGLVVYVGKDTLDVRVGASVYRGVRIAKPLAIEQVSVSDYVALLWTTGELPMAHAVIGHETAMRRDAYEDTTPPPAPRNARIVQAGYGAYLAWEWGGRMTPNLDLAYYEVDGRLPGGTWGYDGTYPTSEGTRTVHHPILPSVTLQVRVRAVDRRGNRSAWVSTDSSGNPLLLADAVAPPAPTGFAVADGYGAIILNWQGPTKLTVPDLAGFRVYAADDTTGTNAEQVAQVAPQLNYSYASLPVGTVYFNLTAIDASGNESSYAVDSWLPGQALAAPGANLLLNSDFERDINADDVPDGWKAGNFTTGSYSLGLYGRDATQAWRMSLPDGNEIHHFNWPDYSSGTRLVRVEYNERYTASIYFYTTVSESLLNYEFDGSVIVSGMLTILLAIANHNGAGTSVYTGLSSITVETLSDGWRRLSVTSVVPSSSLDYIGIDIMVVNKTGAAANIDFDRAQLEKGILTQWKPGIVPPAGGSSFGVLVDGEGIMGGDGTFHLAADGKLYSDLIPGGTSGTYNLGSSAAHFGTVYADSFAGGSVGHDPVSLAVSAQELLGLTNQDISLVVQGANTILAGPTSGADAAPTFRALVAGDLPSIDHGGLAGLADDDHTQYLLADGTRAVTGDMEFQASVGIGASTPGKPLEIYNSASNYDASVRLRNAAHYWDIEGGNVGYASDTLGIRYDGTNVARLRSNIRLGLAGGLVTGNVSADPPTGGLLAYGEADIRVTSATALQVMDAGGTAKFTVDTSSGNAYTPGKLGAGTNPAAYSGVLVAINTSSVVGMDYMNAGWIDAVRYRAPQYDYTRGMIISARSYADTGDSAHGELAAIAGKIYLSTEAGYTNTILHSGAFVADAPSISGTGTVNIPGEAYGLSGVLVMNQGNAALSRSYGIRIRDQTGSTTPYALHTGLGRVSLGDAIELRGTGSISTIVDDLTLSPAGSVFIDTVPLTDATWVKGVTAWGIDENGGGDFRYLWADELHTRVFIADMEQALAGSQMITKSVAPLAATFTVPAEGGNATLVVESFEGYPSFKVFVDGDMIGLREMGWSGTALSVSWCWGTVVWVSTDTTARTQTYTFTRSSSGNGGGAGVDDTIPPGSLVLDLGTSGNGFVESSSVDGDLAAYAPYTQVVTWTTHPNSGRTVRTRQGNLRGLFGTVNEYGLFAGNGIADADKYLAISNNRALFHNLTLSVHDGSTTTIYLDPSAPSLSIGDNANLMDYTTGTGIYLGIDDKGTAYAARIGDPSGDVMYWDGVNLSVTGQIHATTGILDDLTVSGLLSLDTTGEIRGGTTSTGIRFGYLSDGYYLRGVNGGTTQVEIRASDGALRAGGGALTLDADGLVLGLYTSPFSGTPTLQFKDGSGLQTHLGCSNIGGGTYVSSWAMGDDSAVPRIILTRPSSAGPSITMHAEGNPGLTTGTVYVDTDVISTTAHVQADGGLVIGDKATTPAAGELLVISGTSTLVDINPSGTGDGRFAGGLSVGDASTNPGTGEIVATVAASGWLPFAAFGALGNNISAPTTVFRAAVSRSLTIRSWHQAAYVAGTNNGSNYWTISLQKAGGAVGIALNTSAMSAGAWTLLQTTGLSVALSTSDVFVGVYVSKTGSPGNLSLGAPAIFVS